MWKREEERERERERERENREIFIFLYFIFIFKLNICYDMLVNEQRRNIKVGLYKVTLLLVVQKKGYITVSDFFFVFCQSILFCDRSWNYLKNKKKSCKSRGPFVLLPWAFWGEVVTPNMWKCQECASVQQERERVLQDLTRFVKDL